MSTQTEAETSVAEIVRKYTRDCQLDAQLYGRISIQTIICENEKKVMAVKLPRAVLHAAQQNYSSIIKAAKQQFHDYLIVFVRNFDVEEGGATKLQERETSWLANVCFPFLLTGLRTDVRGVDDSVVNVLLEKRASFSKAEMEMLGSALGKMLGRNYAVGVNHHTKN